MTGRHNATARSAEPPAGNPSARRCGNVLALRSFGHAPHSGARP